MYLLATAGSTNFVYLKTPNGVTAAKGVRVGPAGKKYLTTTRALKSFIGPAGQVNWTFLLAERGQAWAGIVGNDVYPSTGWSLVHSEATRPPV